MPYHGWGMGGFALLGAALVVILVLLGVMGVARAPRGQDRTRGVSHGWGRRRALEILRLQYARGTIDGDAFRRRERELLEREED